MNIDDLFEHKPIAENICLKLNFITRLSLCRAFPILRQKIPNLLDFRMIVHKALVELFSIEDIEENVAMRKADTVLTGMLHTQTWMSGSFILKCLTGLDFQVGDIDLFTNNYVAHYVKKYVYINRYKRRDIRIIEYPNISQFSTELYKADVFDIIDKSEVWPGTAGVVKKDNNAVVDEEKASNIIRSIRNFYINKIKVQDIIIDKTFPIDEYIKVIFDMDFLKSMYNGKTLRILNPEAILKQKATVNMFQAYYKCFRHAFSYSKTLVEGKFDFMGHQYKRIKKYRKRGFVVNLDFTKDIQSVERLCQKWENNNRSMTVKDLGLWDYIVNEENDKHFDKSTEEEVGEGYEFEEYEEISEVEESSI